MARQGVCLCGCGRVVGEEGLPGCVVCGKEKKYEERIIYLERALLLSLPREPSSSPFVLDLMLPHIRLVFFT